MPLRVLVDKLGLALACLRLWPSRLKKPDGGVCEKSCDASLQYMVCVLWVGVQGWCITSRIASGIEKVLLEGFISW